MLGELCYSNMIGKHIQINDEKIAKEREKEKK